MQTNITSGQSDAAYVGEVLRLHEVIAGWTTGVAANTDDSFGQFARALAPGFVIINPEGVAEDREAVVSRFRGLHGTRAGREFRIEIREPAVHRETADLALESAGWTEMPTQRSWRLNERHYGTLQGLNKLETAEKYGAEQVMAWRRSFDVPPLLLELSDDRHPSHDSRYDDVDPKDLPSTECLADVVERMLPYWHEEIVPQARAGFTPLIVAHGNSLRALVMHLDEMSESEIVALNIPTGIPLLYELNSEMEPISHRYLGDPEAAQAAADAVGNQAG